MNESTQGHILAMQVAIQALIGMLPERERGRLLEEIDHYARRTAEMSGATLLSDGAMAHMQAALFQWAGYLPNLMQGRPGSGEEAL